LIHLFFTGKTTAEQIKSKAGKDGGKNSMVSLLPRTIFSRPDIPNILKIKAEEKYHGKRVGVFFCGPPAIARTLQSSCSEVSDHNSNTLFSFHKENF